ncbi:MAG: DoxX family protein [Acidobacteriota bacterium]
MMSLEELARALPALLSAAMLIIVFAQSGFDKVRDRQGNLDFLSGHFKGSPLGAQVPLLLTLLTLLELGAALLTLGGIVTWLTTGDSTFLFWAAAVTGATLLALFFGQRMAKDYDGAAVLVPYHILCVILLYLTVPV